ncbi:MAG: epoxyqueuosine reductase [Desulfuromonadaceae bacterium]
MTPTNTEIRDKALSLGAEMVGFAPVSRWRDAADIPVEFHPDHVWPQTKTVIVLAVPVWLPIVETAPAEWGREQYTITNNLLDETAYRLAAFLNRQGHASLNFSRDGYGDIEVLLKNPAAAFSHVWAAHYAGVGQVGWNHTLLTREYGPRVRLVSVLTALELPGDEMIADELCNRCRLCQKICPASVFEGDSSDRYADMNKLACATNSKRLRKSFRNPCGFCIKVCPVGNDRQLFRSTDSSKYFREKEVLAKNPDAAEFRDWQHIRRYGGFPLEDEIL